MAISLLIRLMRILISLARSKNRCRFWISGAEDDPTEDAPYLMPMKTIKNMMVETLTPKKLLIQMMKPMLELFRELKKGVKDPEDEDHTSQVGSYTTIKAFLILSWKIFLCLTLRTFVIYVKITTIQPVFWLVMCSQSTTL
ncbi:unnamed protein product [Brassica oleracea]